jgi:hypothetical protein
MSMSDTIENLLKRNLHEIFGERDAAKRMAVIKETWTEDCIFSDPHGHYVGHRALDGAIGTLHKRFPDYIFSELGVPQTLHDAGRLAWTFGPREALSRVSGLDVIVVRDEKIAALYTFLDKP